MRTQSRRFVGIGIVLSLAFVGFATLGSTAAAPPRAASLPEAVSSADPNANPLSSTMFNAYFGQPGAPGVPKVIVSAVSPLEGVEAGVGWVGANHRVTNDPNNQDEITISANPTDAKNLVAGQNDYGYAGPGYVGQGLDYTTDGGATWTREDVPCQHNYDFTSGGDPAVAFGPDGTAYDAGIVFDGRAGESYIGFAKSTDKGATWSCIAPVVGTGIGGGAGGLWDKPYIAVNQANGDIYITWTMFGNGEIHFIMSTDGGATWKWQSINGLQLAGGTNQFSFPFGGADGNTIYVGYLSCYNGQGLTGFRCVDLVKSTDRGNTFTAGVQVAKLTGETVSGLPFRYVPYPAFAIDNSGGANQGTVYCVVADKVGAKNELLSFLSKDGGATWTPGGIANALGSSTQSPLMPWLQANKAGTIAASWQTWDTSDHSLTPEAAETKSGATWIPLESGDKSSTGSFGGFAGDYAGLAAAADGTFHPGWTDTRDGNNEVYSTTIADAASQIPVPVL
ncbi:MAG: sialidase family protein [Thermoplasmatota archaeon]